MVICIIISFTSGLQVLTFMRADRRIIHKDGTKQPAIAMYLAQLQRHLKTLGIAVPPDLSSHVAQLYPGMTRTGQQHLFLKPGVLLQSIPPRQEALSNGLAEYPRSLMIARCALSKTTLATIDHGELLPTFTKMRNMPCSSIATVLARYLLQLTAMFHNF